MRSFALTRFMWCTDVLYEFHREEWNKACTKLVKEKIKSGSNRLMDDRKQKLATEQYVEVVKSSKYYMLTKSENLIEAYQEELKRVFLHDR